MTWLRRDGFPGLSPVQSLWWPQLFGLIHMPNGRVHELGVYCRSWVIVRLRLTRGQLNTLVVWVQWTPKIWSMCAVQCCLFCSNSMTSVWCLLCAGFAAWQCPVLAMSAMWCKVAWIDLHVLCLNGEGCNLELTGSTMGAGCVPDGFKETSTKERWKTHPAYWFTADAPQDIARARHCGRCNALLHLCSNRFVCCMVLHQRISDRWGRACTRRSDRDWNRKWIHNRVWIHAQPAKKP